MRLKSEILEVLKDLVAAEGVKASAVLSRDGILLDYHNGDISIDILPSILAMMTKCAEKCAKVLKEGDIDYILIKTENGVILTQICPNFIISVTTNGDISINPVLEELNKARRRIRNII